MRGGGYQDSGDGKTVRPPSRVPSGATRNGARRYPDDIQSREGARLAAAHAAKRLVDGIGAFEQAGPATQFAQLTEVRYWADVLAALAAYDRMFERNP